MNPRKAGTSPGRSGPRRICEQDPASFSGTPTRSFRATSFRLQRVVSSARYRKPHVFDHEIRELSSSEHMRSIEDLDTHERFARPDIQGNFIV